MAMNITTTKNQITSSKPSNAEEGRCADWLVRVNQIVSRAARGLMRVRVSVGVNVGVGVSVRLRVRVRMRVRMRARVRARARARVRARVRVRGGAPISSASKLPRIFVPIWFTWLG